MRCLTLLLIAAAFSFAEDPVCTSPSLGIIATKPDPFRSCGAGGSGGNGKPATAAEVLEAHAKNNLCADMTHPVDVDFATLRDMEAPAEKFKPKLADRLHPSRQRLIRFYPFNGTKIGEGTVVRIVARIKDAHVSDCGGGMMGEVVNCHQLGVDKNDFHVPLMDPAKPDDTDECNSVTAEISPHYRPKAWADIDMKTPTGNPVRITGPLFFDNSHEVCKLNPATHKLEGQPPLRSSLWEIHPVYAIEVCANQDAAECDIDDNSAWMPYDEWIGSHVADTTASGQTARMSCEKATGNIP